MSSSHQHAWDTFVGVLAAALALLPIAWDTIHPWIANTTLICGFLLAVHGVYNLIRGRATGHSHVPHDDQHHR